MSLEETLNATGSWLVANCGDLPSQRGCKLVIMSPMDQREDLLNASVRHAIDVHSHEDTPQLRTDIDSMLKTIEL